MSKSDERTFGHIEEKILHEFEPVLEQIETLLCRLSSVWTGTDLHVSGVMRLQKGTNRNDIALPIKVSVGIPGHRLTLAVEPHVVVDSGLGRPTHRSRTLGVETMGAIFLVGNSTLSSPA